MGYYLCPHEKGTPGGGLGVLPLWQDLFQSRCSEAPQKKLTSKLLGEFYKQVGGGGKS